MVKRISIFALNNILDKTLFPHTSDKNTEEPMFQV